MAIGDGSLHVGDRVVYPNQGICKITGVEVKQIAGQEWEVVTLSREEDGATVMVPKAKVMGIGLRKVAQADEVDKVFDLLAAPWDDPQLDWKVRHRENADKMAGGGLMGTVEVLKGLHALARVRPLPAKERELYDNARHMLIREIAAAMSLPNHVAEDNLDYALWPPEGMKRKGRLLPPATLGPPPAPIRPVAADDDDEDDELAVIDEEPAVAAGAPAAAAGEEAGEAEEPVEAARLAAGKKALLAEKPPAAARPAVSRPPPAAAHAVPASKPAPKTHAAPAPKPHPALAPKAHPAPAPKAHAAPPPKAHAAPPPKAHPQPKSKPAGKAAPARKTAHAPAKKTAPAKKQAKAAPAKKASKPASKGKKK